VRSLVALLLRWLTNSDDNMEAKASTLGDGVVSAHVFWQGTASASRCSSQP
jgi:hypothetical protein